MLATMAEVCTLIKHTIEGDDKGLQEINKKIFENPELGWNEFQAHDNIVAFLRARGFSVKEHAYGLATSFSAEFGCGGRVVTFNAEYDALPGIGHACGHNLIATAAIASFLGTSAALRESGIPGRVRLLGTPAEEGPGGKVYLLREGAFDDVDACLMVHPGAESRHFGLSGTAYAVSLAMSRIKATFRGKAAHASVAPHQGINALDAAVTTYNAISVMRQQIEPHERVHGIFTDGGQASNIVPETASMDFQVRSSTLQKVAELRRRTENCFLGAAQATGCEVVFEETVSYADLRPNKVLCTLWAESMENLGTPVNCDVTSQIAGAGSTDQGNVSYVCPAFHGYFGIPADEGVNCHSSAFTKAAGTILAHQRAVATAKGMAQVAWQVLSKDNISESVWEAFDADIATARRNAERELS